MRMRKGLIGLGLVMGMVLVLSSMALASKVDINTASAEELTSVSGISSTQAKKIVKYRKSHGPFMRESDIKQVPGIGPVTYGKFEDGVEVNVSSCCGKAYDALDFVAFGAKGKLVDSDWEKIDNEYKYKFKKELGKVDDPKGNIAGAAGLAPYMSVMFPEIYSASGEKSYTEPLFDEFNGEWGWLEQSFAKTNINTASARELDALPGIGEALAEKIVEYREANGPFESIEDLVNVSQIGEGIVNNIKDSASTTDGETYSKDLITAELYHLLDVGYRASGNVLIGGKGSASGAWGKGAKMTGKYGLFAGGDIRAGFMDTLKADALIGNERFGLNLGLKEETTIGATGKGQIGAYVSKDKSFNIGASGEGILGASAEVSGSAMAHAYGWDIGGVKATATGYAGLAAKGKANIGMDSSGTISVDLGLGAALGLGGALDVGFSINPIGSINVAAAGLSDLGSAGYHYLADNPIIGSIADTVADNIPYTREVGDALYSAGSAVKEHFTTKGLLSMDTLDGVLGWFGVERKSKNSTTIETTGEKAVGSKKVIGGASSAATAPAKYAGLGYRDDPRLGSYNWARQELIEAVKKLEAATAAYHMGGRIK